MRTHPGAEGGQGDLIRLNVPHHAVGSKPGAIDEWEAPILGTHEGEHQVASIAEV